MIVLYVTYNYIYIYLQKLRENVYSVGIAESLLLFIDAPVNVVHTILGILKIKSSRE